MLHSAALAFHQLQSVVERLMGGDDEEEETLNAGKVTSIASSEESPEMTMGSPALSKRVRPHTRDATTLDPSTQALGFTHASMPCVCALLVGKR